MKKELFQKGFLNTLQRLNTSQGQHLSATHGGIHWSNLDSSEHGSAISSSFINQNKQEQSRFQMFNEDSSRPSKTYTAAASYGKKFNEEPFQTLNQEGDAVLSIALITKIIEYGKRKEQNKNAELNIEETFALLGLSIESLALQEGVKLSLESLHNAMLSEKNHGIDQNDWKKYCGQFEKGITGVASGIGIEINFDPKSHMHKILKDAMQKSTQGNEYNER